MDQSRRTGLESSLLWWTIGNACLGFWLLLSGTPEVFGSGFAVFIPLMVALPLTLWLIWRLFSPTRLVLLIGSLFWALQVITVAFPDALYGFRLGLAVNFRLIQSDSYTLSVDLLAILTCVAFLVASHERLRLLQSSSGVQ